MADGKNADVKMAADIHEKSNEPPRLDGVTCDFSMVNRGWEKKMNALHTKTLRSQATTSKAKVVKIAKQDPDAPPAMQFEFAKAQAEADDDIANSAELMVELDEQMVELLVGVLAQVAPDNLSPNAPKDLDWNDIDSFDWISDFQGVVAEIMAQRVDLRKAKKK